MSAANFREFIGRDAHATYLWPRWLILRAVGIIYLLVFAGIIAEGGALIGPNGIAPLSDFAAAQAKLYPNALEGFLRAPGLFWLGAGPAMIATLEWAGLAAAAALTLNLWPRLALFGCWLIFLSFLTAAGGHFFSLTQPDQLMIETALLCIPFAPRGLRPGLGAASPPRPIAVFAMRWLLFRIMFEAGLSKFVFGGPRWRNLTAMDVMYENSPFPTILGYWDHQLPHAYHVLEIEFTFAAEIAAPLLAVFGGRRWRWPAFCVWVAFQAGIELTNNFGWLNVASIALGLLLLDDQMLGAAGAKLGLEPIFSHAKAQRRKENPTAGIDLRALAPLRETGSRSGVRRWGLRVALGVQIFATLYFFILSCGLPAKAIPGPVSRPLNLLFGGLRSANAYFLFSNLQAIRYDIEFEGSNDGGETWRTYEFRYQAQRVDKICRFIAPWYPRFEATLQNTVVTAPQSTLFPAVAADLLERNPGVMRLFDGDPFSDRPPTMIRMAIYRLSFTDLREHRATGDFWRKEYEGDYMPMVYLDGRGEIMGGE